jgi:hypothetical protein
LFVVLFVVPKRHRLERAGVDMTTRDLSQLLDVWMNMIRSLVVSMLIGKGHRPDAVLLDLLQGIESLGVASDRSILP